MEHNSTATSSSLRQQSRDHQLTQKLQDRQHQEQQQANNNNNNNEHQQQFCLRWHNHQTSLLSTLPILLDQSHLTDVTISAEGRTLRAHRVVLSACSSFFLEIFRTLESTHHPVIIIPGASFTAIVALLTFMYSGEVNVYEEQIPMLLSLAETLGIKGLADVHNNLQRSTKSSSETETLDCKKEPEKSQTPPSSSPTPTSSCGNFSLPQIPVSTNSNRNMSSTAFNPLLSPSFNAKFSSPLENFFLKSLQFYPNLMHQPLNFSQTALNKTTELLAKYQQQCSLYQTSLGMPSPKDLMPPLIDSEEETQLAKRFCTGLEKKSIISQQQLQQNQMLIQQQKDIKRIDKIVENLRVGGAGNNSTSPINKTETNPDNLTSSALTSHLHSPLTPHSIKTSLENYTTNTSAVLTAKSSLFSSPSNTETPSALHSQLAYNISAEDQLKLQQHLDKYAQSCARSMEAANENIKIEAARMMSNEKLATSGQAKTPSNSKLYATCFICHKQLSNQYNLRVHLETHQNVRYACNVCSHVSRSKDALRKHVSYRHPGAPSPCETEARRKRANKVLASQLNVGSSASSGEATPTSPNTPAHFQTPSASTTAIGNDLNNNESSALTAAQITSAYQMFMPQQFRLAAAAVNAAQQQQQPQSCSANQVPSKDFNNPAGATSTSTTTHMPNTTNNSAKEDSTFNLNSSPVPTTSTNNDSSNNIPTNELQNTTNNSNNNNNNTENRISPNSSA